MIEYRGPNSDIVNSLFDEEAKTDKLDGIPIEAILAGDKSYTRDELGRAAIWHLLAETGALSEMSDYLKRVDFQGGRVFRGITEEDKITFKWEGNEKSAFRTALSFILNEPAQTSTDDFFVTAEFLDRILHVSEGNISARLTGDIEDSGRSVTLAKLALVGKLYLMSVSDRIRPRGF